MRLMWVTPNEASLPFVNAAPNSRGYSEETRKVIRSHVMLGKNRGKKLRTHATTRIKSSTASNKDASIQEAHFDHRNEDAIIPIPAKVGSEVTFTEFPNEVGLQMLDAIRTCKHIEFGDISALRGATFLPNYSEHNHSPLHSSIQPRGNMVVRASTW